MSTKPSIAAAKTSALRPLKGVRILSLALNLPGPAALMRCRDMGARCTKLEPPPHPSAPKGTTGDPMGLYNPQAYATLHAGMKIASAVAKCGSSAARATRPSWQG